MSKLVITLTIPNNHRDLAWAQGLFDQVIQPLVEHHNDISMHGVKLKDEWVGENE